MFETAFSPFWASLSLGVAMARSVVKNQCGGTTRELQGWILERFRGRRPFRKFIFRQYCNLVGVPPSTRLWTTLFAMTLACSQKMVRLQLPQERRSRRKSAAALFDRL